MVYSVRTTPDRASEVLRTTALAESSHRIPSTVPAVAVNVAAVVGGAVSMRATAALDQGLHTPKESAACTRQYQSPSASAGDRQVSAAESTAPLSAATAVKAG